MNKMISLLFGLNRSFAVALSFALFILSGTFLLMLPVSNTSNEWMPFIDALFTATSASCVTGLAVVDTGNYFSLFGKTVLIFLIQIGGLGVMTLTTLLALGLGRRIDLKERLLLQESLNQDAPTGIVRLVNDIVRYTLIIEFCFGTVFALYFFDEMGIGAFYWGYWHAVSAFCNAGFDLLGNYDSLVAYSDNIIVNICFMSLIVIGGIGFSVIGDVSRHRGWKKLSLHTKIVLTVNTLLIFGGALMIWLLEARNAATIGSFDAWHQMLAALFQSISARTAGFNTIDLGAMNMSTMFFIMLLMFVGASSTSTGGGIKTTTFAVLVTSTLALLRGKKDVVLFNRRIDQQTISKGNSIFVLALLWLAAALFLLLVCDTGNHPFHLVLFELISAFGTVGMGVGITTEWNSLCKAVLIATMFIGRVGILTFGMSFFNKKADRVRYPAENIIIG